MTQILFYKKRRTIKMNKQFLGSFTLVSDALITKYGRPYEALVFGKIWRYSQMKRGFCSKSFPNLGSELGISEATVARAIKVLKRDNFIKDITPVPFNTRGFTRHYIPNKEVFDEFISGISQIPLDDSGISNDESGIPQIDSGIPQMPLDAGSGISQPDKEYNTLKNTKRNSKISIFQILQLKRKNKESLTDEEKQSILTLDDTEIEKLYSPPWYADAIRERIIKNSRIFFDDGYQL
jgi:hypothetical protein